VFVCGHTVASAETDLLNLSDYAEGTRVPYGENMVVVQDEETGEKWITAAEGTKGRLNIPINLPSESFEIFMEIHAVASAFTSGFFLIADEIQFKFNFYNYHTEGETSIEGSSKRIPVWQKKAKNAARFIINGGVAKVYVNEVFVQKVTVSEEKQGVTYTNLMVTNISDGYILYSLKIKGASDVVVPDSSSSSTSTTPATTGDCMASYTVMVNCTFPVFPYPGHLVVFKYTKLICNSGVPILLLIWI
jgi:hypothetical protein